MKKSIITIFILSISLSLFGQCFPERHSTNWFDAWVSCETSISPNSSKSHWIMYELDALYKIDKFKIWNINDPSHLEWGTKNLLIEYSEDGKNWFIGDSFVLTKATGTNDYEGDDCFLARRDLDAVLLVEAHHRSHHHRRAVGQRDETDLHLFQFRLVGARRPNAACREHRTHCCHSSEDGPGFEKAAAGKNFIVDLLAHRSPQPKKSEKKEGAASPHRKTARDGRPCPSEIA